MTKTKEEWLEVHLRALPKEVMNLLDITDLTKCSLEETELFKIVLNLYSFLLSSFNTQPEILIGGQRFFIVTFSFFWSIVDEKQFK